MTPALKRTFYLGYCGGVVLFLAAAAQTLGYGRQPPLQTVTMLPAADPAPPVPTFAPSDVTCPAGTAFDADRFSCVSGPDDMFGQPPLPTATAPTEAAPKPVAPKPASRAAASVVASSPPGVQTAECDQVMADGTVYCGEPGGTARPNPNMAGTQTADAVTIQTAGGYMIQTGRAELAPADPAYEARIAAQLCAAKPWVCP